MTPRGLLARILLSTVTAGLLVALLTGLVGAERTAAALRDATTRRATLLALSTAARLQDRSQHEQSRLAAALQHRLGVGVTVLDGTWRPCEGAPSAPWPSSDPWWATHAPTARGAETHRGRVVAMEPLRAPEGDGTLVVSLPASQPGAAVTVLLLRLLAVLVGAGLVGLAASFAVARDIAADVRSIADQARRMGRSAGARALAPRGRDEVGALVRSFNALHRRFEAESAQHRDALVRLEETDRRRQALVATLRHELRTPLNAIIGFADLMLSDVDGPLMPAQREDVQMIAQAGRHLLRLVDDVFDLSAMANGRYALHPSPMDLARVARDVVAEAEGLARGRSVTLDLDAPERADIRGDAVALRRALTNLVHNAVEHAGGTVRVKVSARDAGFTVEVEDNGPGIAPEELRRLFKPFERGRTAEARGAGLGLAITLGLVELHGGTLSATSVEGRGSVFTLTIPDGAEAAS